MQTVNIQENEEYQRDIIRNFTKKIREKRFLLPEDFDKTFEFFCKIIEVECKSYNIECGYNRKNNKLEWIKQEVADNMPEEEWQGIEVASCDYSDELGEDVTFSFDPVFYCKKYFGKEKLENRLEGVVELLFSAYHEVDHSVKLVNFGRSYLSPETLETARELFLREVYGEEFYRDNYSVLSFERYADEYAYGTTLEMVTDSDVLKIAEEKISKKRLGRDDIPFAELGKLKYDGIMHIKRDLLFRLSLLEMKRNPKFLYMYPIFGKQYRNDGTQKDIHELFETMNEDFRKIIHRHTSLDSSNELTPALQKEYFDCQTFYYELILPHISLANEKDYIKLAEKYGVTFLQNFLSGMEKYFNIRAQERLEHSEKYNGEKFETADEIKRDLKKTVNSIVRFRNGAALNKITEELLRTGGFVRGTREILTPEVLKRREVLVASLIGVYDAIESEDEYKTRAENERTDIDEVINALYYNRFENFLKNVEIPLQEEKEFGRAEIVRTVQILKMVKLLSKETGKDYLLEFLKIPDVNRLLGVFEKDKNGYLKNSILKAQLRIKNVVYPLTEAENGKYRDYMLGKDKTEEGEETKRKLEMLNEEMEVNKPRRNIGFGRN